MSVTRKYRFAVVMYGGISLAVYINGVAQELMTLVRSTAVDRDVKPSPLLKLYRQVAEKFSCKKIHNGNSAVTSASDSSSPGQRPAELWARMPTKPDFADMRELDLVVTATTAVTSTLQTLLGFCFSTTSCISVFNTAGEEPILNYAL